METYLKHKLTETFTRGKYNETYIKLFNAII